MADKLMFIFNEDTQNYPFCILKLVVKTLDTHLKKPTNYNLIKNAQICWDNEQENVIINFED